MYKKYFKLELEQFEESPVFSIHDDPKCSRMEIRLLTNGKPLDLSGYRVKIKANQPNGKSVFWQCGITANKKGQIYLELVKHLEYFDVRLPCVLMLDGPGELQQKTLRFHLIIESNLDIRALDMRGGRTVIDNVQASNIRLIAHRGLSALAPENTLPAYHLAGKYGYFAAECDIWETSDGEFILMHDRLLNRTSNGSGRVKDYTLEEIQTLVINKGSFIECYPELKIPTLSEYLYVCKYHGIVPIIEIKNIDPDAVDRLLKQLASQGYLTQMSLISFQKEVITEIRMKNKEINLQWITDLTKENIEYCVKYQMGISCSKKTISKEWIEYAHSCGVLVNVWTVNRGEELSEYMRMGVDFITTNVLLHQQSLKSSGMCQTYRLINKKDYALTLNDSLKESKKDKLLKSEWKWHDEGKIIEIKGDPTSLAYLEIKLPPLQAGDVITISCHHHYLSGSKIKTGIQYVEHNGAVTMERSTKTYETNDWGYVESQFIVLHHVDATDDYYNALIGNWSSSASHFMLRHVCVKVEFM